MEANEATALVTSLRLQPNDTIVVRGGTETFRAVISATRGQYPMVLIGPGERVAVAESLDFWEAFHHKVVDEGLIPLRPDLQVGQILEQAGAVVDLLAELARRRNLAELARRRKADTT